MLNNKIVKVSDYHLIQFFYPDFVVREEISFLDQDNKVLYIGKSRPQLKKFLGDHTKEFISVSGPPDIDLTVDESNKDEHVEEVLTELASHRPNGKVPKRIVELAKNMSQSDIEDMCKVYYVCGKWPGSEDLGDATFYNLFQASCEGKSELLRIYYQLREVYSYHIIEQSFLTFLVNVVKVDEISKSPGYMMLLKKANSRFGQKIYPLLKSKYSRYSTEITFIGLMLDLVE